MHIRGAVKVLKVGFTACYQMTSRPAGRMVGRRDEDSAEAMIDVTYRQSAAEREVVFVLQRLYLCASVEFLMAVADFFLQALPQTPNTAASDRLPLKQTAKPRAHTSTGTTYTLSYTSIQGNASREKEEHFLIESRLLSGVAPCWLSESMLNLF